MVWVEWATEPASIWQLHGAVGGGTSNISYCVAPGSPEPYVLYTPCIPVHSITAEGLRLVGSGRSIQSPFYRDGDQDLEWGSNLPKVIANYFIYSLIHSFT